MLSVKFILKLEVPWRTIRIPLPTEKRSNSAVNMKKMLTFRKLVVPRQFSLSLSPDTAHWGKKWTKKKAKLLFSKTQLFPKDCTRSGARVNRKWTNHKENLLCEREIRNKIWWREQDTRCMNLKWEWPLWRELAFSDVCESERSISVSMIPIWHQCWKITLSSWPHHDMSLFENSSNSNDIFVPHGNMEIIVSCLHKIEIYLYIASL